VYLIFFDNSKTKMIKTLFLIVFVFLITGCSQEKASLEEVLIEKMSEDKDQQDYNIPPEEMAACVLTEIDRQIPGFMFGPGRDKFYAAYKIYLGSNNSKNILNAINASEETFGSKESARKAFFAVSDHIFLCMGAVMGTAEDE